jgi:hypothetical protein
MGMCTTGDPLCFRMTVSMLRTIVSTIPVAVLMSLGNYS